MVISLIIRWGDAVDIFVALGGALAVIVAFFATFFVGKSKGKNQERDNNERLQEIKKVEILESDKLAKEESRKITNEVNQTIDSSKPGDSDKWLRENFNRDG